LAGAEGFEPPLAVLETAGLPLNLRPWVIPPGGGPAPTHPIPILLDFLVWLVLSTVRAELAQFQPFRGGFLVLGCRVIAILALPALESNDFTSHLIAPFKCCAHPRGPDMPKPIARPVWNTPEQSTVRNTGAVDRD